MKTIRLIAACLLIFTGVLHIIPIIRNDGDPNAVPMLVFGIAYFLVGVLLYLKIKFSEYLGIVFPLAGLAVGFFVVGLNKWTAMLTFLFAIDFIVLACCIAILLNKNKA
jgi:hypothetical protein